jgi:adenine-specific DNA-methyltransferase
VKDGRDTDLTQEPEMIRAFRDTWELGVHSYLTHLRDRLLLARELLSESGSVFVQISEENLHHVRELMDEVFGSENLANIIVFRKTAAVSSPMARVNVLAGTCDYVVWYAKDKASVKYRPLFLPKGAGSDGAGEYVYVDLEGERRKLTRQERRDLSTLPGGARLYRQSTLTSTGYSQELSRPFTFEDHTYSLSGDMHWKTTQGGLHRLAASRRLERRGTSLAYVRYLDDFPVFPLVNVWMDTSWGFGEDKNYVVQTAAKVIQRCILMTTDPGDLVLDPTSGSGTTAFAAEQWGRRWITCDTSRVALALAKQRLMTSLFDYYELAHPEEGVGSGFRYKTVPHITLKSIANNPEIKEGMSREKIDAAIAKHAPQETLYDQPHVDRNKARVTGPFTVEAVPAPTVTPLTDIEMEQTADDSVARTGPTLRQEEWRDELLKTGIRGKGGQMIHFSRVEPLGGTRYLHADAETDGDQPERVVVSFGSVDAPLEQRQVELAFGEAHSLMPRPSIIVFAAFQFDPEAAKDIDALTKEKTGMTFLKAQMNTDLLTEDLKKKRANNQSFWLIGQPDVEVREVKNGDEVGKCQVEVHGFDYYNTRTGNIESGDTSKIAMWMLDTDYDGRSLYPRQVFFPLADSKGGWSRLAKNLKAQIDEELVEAYRGTVSLPFEPGEHRRLAVKIVDDRGIESLKVVEVG